MVLVKSDRYLTAWSSPCSLSVNRSRQATGAAGRQAPTRRPIGHGRRYAADPYDRHGQRRLRYLAFLDYSYTAPIGTPAHVLRISATAAALYVLWRSDPRQRRRHHLWFLNSENGNDGSNVSVTPYGLA